MNFPDDLRLAIESLTPDQQKALHAWLSGVIATDELTVPNQPGRAVVDSFKSGEQLYRLEKRRCGKENCKCMNGEVDDVGHGPYWYKYWREDGKLRSGYVGKKLDRENLDS